MAVTERVEIEGHIIDSLILAKVLDLIVAAGADYQLLDVEIGRGQADPSRAEIDVTAGDEDSLNALLEELQVHGANRAEGRDAVLVPSNLDGVMPEGFYATTNLATSVRV